MITSNGSIIPDPPTDPIERRNWKLQNYARLYGSDATTIRKLVEQSQQSIPDSIQQMIQNETRRK